MRSGVAGPAGMALAMLASFEASAAEPYRTPPQVLVDLVDAPPTPSLVLSPDRRSAVLVETPVLVDLEELSRRELRVAGLRLSPANSGRSRVREARSLTFLGIDGGSLRPIEGLPTGARLGSPDWSPDGRRIAFEVYGEERIEMWLAELATARASRLLANPLNTTAGESCAWTDSRTMVCATVPADRGAEPLAPSRPAGPVVQEHAGAKAPARTYQDLLENARDEQLFEHYLKAQLVRVEIGAAPVALGAPALIWSFRPSPDGQYLLVQTIHRPYSYLVPASRFPLRTEVRELAGERVIEIADVPLREQVPTANDAAPTGPRGFAWRADVPATLYWVEAQDGGDPKTEAEVRDKLSTLAAPFDGPALELARTALRFESIDWGTDEIALLHERWWKTRRVKTSLIAPARPELAPSVLWDRSSEDRYGDPGRALDRLNRWGRNVLDLGKDGNTLSLVGTGASPEGDRPFLDTYTLDTRRAERRFRSEPPWFEQPIALLGEAGTRLVTRRESTDEQPDYFVRDLASGALERVTSLPHPTPELRGMSKELIHYERADGVKLKATLYLPPGYDRERDGALPMLVWAYPQEFKDADFAGQVSDSPYRFARLAPTSPLLFLARGYAVLDDPSMPIVGEGEREPNDDYVNQLVASAEAAVREAARRGVADPDRVAIGGHSYGAFMTANLLAHTDLFRAGIARSGAYNRTLTPFGFQSEERSLWEAPEVYMRMSPYLHADRLNEPLLLIHGEADNNSGTFPMQSERFYEALKGHGATARLVMLPHESHGYRARESVLHMLWEMDAWLERWVMPSQPSHTR